MSPLPFAPPPKDSSLYQQLESTTLQTLTADQLDTIRAKTFSQGTDGNEDEYRRLLLLGLAADKLSTSGPIPGTGKIVATSIAAGGATSEIIFRPDEGEVWQITGATTNAMGASRVELHLNNGSALVEIGAETAAATQFDPDGWNPVYIDNNVYLSYFISGLTSTTSFNVAFIRVR